jgi:predicted RNA binding protein YcfA (HicA-like mRNA interferase family)
VRWKDWGFVQLRQKGSHLIMRRGAVGCVVPMHREIKIGTLTGILRQAGVSADQFIDAL